MDKFDLHGQADFSIEGKILIINGHGPWNLEAIMDAKERVMPFVSKLSGSPWGVLLILHGESIYVPNAAEYLIKSVQELRKIGRTATAILAEEANEPEFAKRHMSSIFTEAGETFSFFKQKNQASQWLAEKIKEAEQTIKDSDP